MANISPRIIISDGGTYGYIIWETMLTTDVGLGVIVPGQSDKTVQVIGNFSGAATVNMQGSPDGTTYGNVHDQGGVDVNPGDTEPLLIAENPIYLRPSVAAGDGTTDLDVYVSFALRGK